MTWDTTNLRSSDMKSASAFIARLFEHWPEDWPEGCDAQELAVEYGILLPVEVTEPCGEVCSCAEYHGDAEGMAEGVTCYRLAPFIKRWKRWTKK